MAPNFQGAQFLWISQMVLQPRKLCTAKLVGIDLLYIYVFLGSMPFRAVVWRVFRPCLSSTILAQSAQIRSCQTHKERLPETFCLPRFLLQMQRWSTCRENSKIQYLEVEEGVVCKVHGRTKGCDSKASSRARDSFNHPQFCKELSRS